MAKTLPPPPRREFPDPEYYRVAQVAAKLNVSKRHIYDLCERGDLDCISSGTVKLISAKALARYLAEAAKNRGRAS